MTQHWKEIWNQRIMPRGGGGDLETLIKLDGFDTGGGRIEVADDWRIYVKTIAEKLGIKDGESVFEVGCGAGAFLYALQEKYLLKVGGLDYATCLIAAAKLALPEGYLEVREANCLEITQQYDYVIANSVFFYFDLEYAAEVLYRMIKKAKNAVAVMDVPDMKTKIEAEATRRDTLTPEVYEEKYAGLEHTYYNRSWFSEQAQTHSCICEYFDGCIPNYAHNRFRFGCIIRK